MVLSLRRPSDLEIEVSERSRERRDGEREGGTKGEGGREEGGRERQHRHTDRHSDCMNRCVCARVQCDVHIVVWERRAIHIDCMIQHVDVSPGVVASEGETNAWVVPSANSTHKPASPKICNTER